MRRTALVGTAIVSFFMACPAAFGQGAPAGIGIGSGAGSTSQAGAGGVAGPTMAGSGAAGTGGGLSGLDSRGTHVFGGSGAGLGSTPGNLGTGVGAASGAAGAGVGSLNTIQGFGNDVRRADNTPMAGVGVLSGNSGGTAAGPMTGRRVDPNSESPGIDRMLGTPTEATGRARLSAGVRDNSTADRTADPAPAAAGPTGNSVAHARAPAATAPVARSQDDWRMVYHGGRYWFYTPANRWMYYADNRWHLFEPAPVAATAAAGTGLPGLTENERRAVVFYQGRYWSYTPTQQWMYFTNDGWKRYSPPPGIDRAPSGATDSAGEDGWRTVNYQGRYWYYTPSSEWMYYGANGWERFNPPPTLASRPGPYATGAGVGELNSVGGALTGMNNYDQSTSSNGATGAQSQPAGPPPPSRVVPPAPPGGRVGAVNSTPAATNGSPPSQSSTAPTLSNPTPSLP